MQARPLPTHPLPSPARCGEGARAPVSDREKSRARAHFEARTQNCPWVALMLYVLDIRLSQHAGRPRSARRAGGVPLPRAVAGARAARRRRTARRGRQTERGRRSARDGSRAHPAAPRRARAARRARRTGAGADAPTRAEGDAAALRYAAATRREAELVAAAAHADERREAAARPPRERAPLAARAPGRRRVYGARGGTSAARAQRGRQGGGARAHGEDRRVEELTALAARYRAELATADKRADVGRARRAALARGRGRQQS